MSNNNLVKGLVGLIAGATIVFLSGCATKGFVRSNAAVVNDKVNTLSSALEQTQKRIGTNAAHIHEVDQTVTHTLQTATKAYATAAEAGDLAAAVGRDIEALEEAGHKLTYDIVIREQQTGFRFDSVELPEEARKNIDDLVARLKQEPKDVFITIEGHTDNVGSTTVNERIGLARALAIERYLYDRHHIPLHKMEVISYGEDQPIAPNTTRNGRAQNRRVEIKIVS
jgi:outer membrane protein OmpA-like peptidoglycan-associated protein